MLINLDCPVELIEYQIYKSKSTGRIYCSLIFNNVSDKVVKGIKADIYCYDQFGDAIGKENSMECKIGFNGGMKPNQYREIDEKILISNFLDTRKLDVVITKVLFNDQSIWEIGTSQTQNVDLNKIKNPKHLEFIVNQENVDAKYFSKNYGDKWSCICGRFNYEYQLTCQRCKREKDIILTYYSDEERLNNELKVFELHKAEEEKSKQEEKERLIEINKKKTKKYIINISTIMTIIIIIGVTMFGFMTKFTFSWANYQLLKDKDKTLIEAVKRENQEDIKFLVNNGASTNFKNTKGENAISEAIKLSNKSLVASLLSEDSRSIRVGDDGNTLAHIAVKYEHLDILREIQKKGFDMNTTNEKGETILYSAIEVGNEDIINYLIKDIGVNVQKVDSKQNNVIQAALVFQSKNLELIKELLKLNINLLIENIEGKNSFESAILTHNSDIVDEFITIGMDLNNIDGDLNNAIHVYLDAEKENALFLRSLIKKGTNVNGYNKEGHSPLYIAIQKDKRYSVEELLQNKVDTIKVNSDGKTAKEVAENYNKLMVELFENDSLAVRIDKNKEVFTLNGVSLNSSNQAVINALGNPGSIGFDEDISSEYYVYPKVNNNQEFNLKVYFYNNKVDFIVFDFYKGLINEGWYKNLGKPYAESGGVTYFYLESSAQLLMFKPAENNVYLTYSDGTFGYYFGDGN